MSCYRNKATEEKVSAMLPLVSNKRTYIHIFEKSIPLVGYTRDQRETSCAQTRGKLTSNYGIHVLFEFCTPVHILHILKYKYTF